jgi:hypothetical protein
MREPSQFPGGRRLRPAAVFLISAGLLLNGCTAIQDIQSSIDFSGDRYRDPSDECSVYREPLIKSKDQFLEPILIGAGVGAVSGAAVGAAISSGDRLLGAVIGGITGALVGATAGYLKAKQDQAKTEAEILTAINNDIQTSKTHLGPIGSSLRQLNLCRSNQIASLGRDVDAKRVSGEEGRARLAKIRERLQLDKELVNAVLGEVDKGNQVYVNAIAETRKVDEKIVAGEARNYQPKVRPGGYYVAQTSKMRAAASNDSAQVGTARKGQSVNVIADSGSWKRIRIDGVDGYVPASAVAARGGKGASDTLPTVDRSNRPKSKDAVQELMLVSAETRTEYDVQYASLEGDLNALEILVQ